VRGCVWVCVCVGVCVCVCVCVCVQGNQLKVLRGRGLKQLVHLRSLSLSHNLLTDPCEVLSLIALLVQKTNTDT